MFFFRIAVAFVFVQLFIRPGKLLNQCFGNFKSKTLYNFNITSVVYFLCTNGHTYPERIYNLITAMGFSAMFTFQLDNTKR